MDVRAFDSAAEFLAVASGFLEEREAEHNLLLGVAGRIAAGGRGGPRATRERPCFWLVEEAGSPVGAALLTPPYDLVLGLCEPGAPAALARALAAENRELPGAVGPESAAGELARAWEAETGSTAVLWRPERLHVLTEVTAPADVPGSMRRAEADDLPLLVRWIEAFGRDAGEDAGAAAAAADGLDEGRYFLWLDPTPVSLAGWARRTRTGVAVAPVYTPPERRGRGYATAVTAALSQRLLDEGRAFCCLYTDRRDPVPNRIYARIGYRPLLDVSHYRFAAG